MTIYNVCVIQDLYNDEKWWGEPRYWYFNIFHHFFYPLHPKSNLFVAHKKRDHVVSELQFARGETWKMAYAKQGQEGKTRLERLQDTARDFAHFLYNRDNEEGKITVLGRDGASWGKCGRSVAVWKAEEMCISNCETWHDWLKCTNCWILSMFSDISFVFSIISAKLSVFFLIFYGCLAGFFAAMLNIFLTTVPEKEMGPKVRRFLDNRPGMVVFQLLSSFARSLLLKLFANLLLRVQTEKCNWMFAGWGRLVAYDCVVLHLFAIQTKFWVKVLG